MFDKSLLDFFELSHILRRDHNISLTEYNQMLPWHLDVYLSLIRRDQEEAKEKYKKGSQSF